MPLLPGLEVLDRLGSGAGEVWRARDRGTGELVVVRRVEPAVLEDGRLGGEADVLRELDTPHLVRVRAVLADEGATWLVLDHAPGGSLAALLRRRGRLDAGEVVTVGVPLAEALAAA
ncbi:MAG: protein kinase, partial [Actinomycetota bacterium]|nr:protein kinase [Actinomycetota bacterium]